MAYITGFTLKEKNIYAVVLLYFFVGICLPQCSLPFLADFWTFFLKGISYHHKMLCLRRCRVPTSFPLSTNMSCMCKQSHSSSWWKITTGHCNFNVWPLYLIFKIGYHSTKTQTISEVAYEHKVVIRISSLKKWGICAFSTSLIIYFLVM